MNREKRQTDKRKRVVDLLRECIELRDKILPDVYATDS